MTDITELAQREKFEAWVMTQICISKSTLEGLRTVEGYRNSTLSGTDYNRLWSLYQSAASEQVEALEKAQQRIDSQREYYEGVIADGGKRIAELESRTVKLPQRHSMLLREGFNEDYHTEMAFKADEVQASLAAAGIKVETE